MKLVVGLSHETYFEFVSFFCFQRTEINDQEQLYRSIPAEMSESNQIFGDEILPCKQVSFEMRMLGPDLCIQIVSNMSGRCRKNYESDQNRFWGWNFGRILESTDQN